jgi:hypothetical protein
LIKFVIAIALVSPTAQAGSLCNPDSWQILVKLAAEHRLEWNGAPSDCWLERDGITEVYISDRYLSPSERTSAIVYAEPTRIQYRLGDTDALCIELQPEPLKLGESCP